MVHWRLKCTGPLVLWATGFQNFFPALLAKLFLNFNLYFLIQTVISQLKSFQLFSPKDKVLVAFNLVIVSVAMLSTDWWFICLPGSTSFLLLPYLSFHTCCHVQIVVKDGGDDIKQKLWTQSESSQHLQQMWLCTASVKCMNSNILTR